MHVIQAPRVRTKQFRPKKTTHDRRQPPHLRRMSWIFSFGAPAAQHQPAAVHVEEDAEEDDEEDVRLVAVMSSGASLSAVPSGGANFAELYERVAELPEQQVTRAVAAAAVALLSSSPELIWDPDWVERMWHRAGEPAEEDDDSEEAGDGHQGAADADLVSTRFGEALERRRMRARGRRGGPSTMEEEDEEEEGERDWIVHGKETLVEWSATLLREHLRVPDHMSTGLAKHLVETLCTQAIGADGEGLRNAIGESLFAATSQ